MACWRCGNCTPVLASRSPSVRANWACPWAYRLSLPVKMSVSFWIEMLDSIFAVASAGPADSERTGPVLFLRHPPIGISATRRERETRFSSGSWSRKVCAAVGKRTFESREGSADEECMALGGHSFDGDRFIAWSAILLAFLPIRWQAGDEPCS